MTDPVVDAVVATMRGALAFASLRDQLVGEGGHTAESARDFLVKKFARPGLPSIVDLIDWWDSGCDYSMPSFARILESCDIPPDMMARVVARGMEPDGVMVRMQAAAIKTRNAVRQGDVS